jgi:hypothetical protein
VTAEHVLTADDKCPCGQPQEGSGYCSYDCFSKYEMGSPIEPAEMPAVPAVAAAPGRTASERPETRTGVSETPSEAQAIEDLSSKHWLKWNTIARVITGCQCGFRADESSDCGFGDSVVAHLLEVGATAARPAHYREAAESLRKYARPGMHPEYVKGFISAAALLDSVAFDLDEEG